MRIGARAFLIAIGVCIAVPAAAQPLTARICEYWPLGAGNRWDTAPDSDVAAYNIIAQTRVNGIGVCEMRTWNCFGITGACHSGTGFVASTDAGMFMESSVEQLLAAIDGEEPMLEPSFYDGQVLTDTGIKVRVAPLSTIQEETAFTFQNLAIPLDTMCLTIYLQGMDGPVATAVWAKGFGPILDVYSGLLFPSIVSSAPCELPPADYSGDRDHSGTISLAEILRVIQFYNSGGFRCAGDGAATEDGLAPGPAAPPHACLPADYDNSPQDWQVSLSELLRVIQFYNAGGVYPCPDAGTEDGFCPGQPS